MIEGKSMFGSDRTVVGYDLSNEYAQISFCRQNEDNVQTVSLLEGTEQFNIPVCLFKRAEVNQWFFGKEAQAYSAVEEGTMLSNLLELSIIGDEIAVEEEYFDPAALLTLFIKRSLSLLKGENGKGKIAGIMFTLPTLTNRVISVLSKVSSLLDMKDVTIVFQGREESIYHYLIHQPPELWKHEVEVYDFSEHSMKSYHFYQNKHTRPVVSFVEESRHEEAVQNDTMNLDQIFWEIVEQTTSEKQVSCAYLLGDGFAQDWCQESLRLLCRNRRVFRGNNLYSKGACYSIKERLNNTDNVNDRIFLGKDKLKANIGMNVIRKQDLSYLALLNGGDNWYDSRKECDIILWHGNSFDIVITPLDGRNIRTVEVVLQGLPAREDKTTRLRINVFMETDSIMRITVKDMGFGDIVATSGMNFTQQITLF